MGETFPSKEKELTEEVMFEYAAYFLFFLLNRHLNLK